MFQNLATAVSYGSWPKPNKPVTRGNKGSWGAET
jgi:hypothetical protein